MGEVARLKLCRPKSAFSPHKGELKMYTFFPSGTKSDLKGDRGIDMACHMAGIYLLVQTRSNIDSIYNIDKNSIYKQRKVA